MRRIPKLRKRYFVHRQLNKYVQCPDSLVSTRRYCDVTMPHTSIATVSMTSSRFGAMYQCLYRRHTFTIPVMASSETKVPMVHCASDVKTSVSVVRRKKRVSSGPSRHKSCVLVAGVGSPDWKWLAMRHEQRAGVREIRYASGDERRPRPGSDAIPRM